MYFKNENHMISLVFEVQRKKFINFFFCKKLIFGVEIESKLFRQFY